MPNLLKKITEKEMNRRDFLKTSAVGAAMLAFLDTGGNALAPTAAAAASAAVVSGEGKWVPAACWFNCGGRCYNAAYVVDNVVVRQKTDDTHPDSPDYPQQRSCLRGRSQRQHVFGADRLKYPMKRKHWQPLTGGDKLLRGKDEWERISWDEALDYVAAELKNTREKYGSNSILVPCWGGERCEIFPALLSSGGYTEVSDTGSYGTGAFASAIVGDSFWGAAGNNDRYDLLKSETIVLHGGNMAWGASGLPSYNMLQAKKAGAEIIHVGPGYNVTADLLDAKWIRVRPGTDTAFLLSVAYVMITEDDPDSNPIIDWDFLDRCTVGFDADHMPEDATVNENFKDYVLGKYDNQPKTPEWATEICGTPVEDIFWFAREIRKDKKVSLLRSLAPARCNNADDFPQIFLTVGAMGGHIGKPGHNCGTSCSYGATNGGSSLVGLPSTFGTSPPNPIDDIIPAPELWDAVINGKYNCAASYSKIVDGKLGTPSYGERDIDIHFIYHAWRNSLQTIVGSAKGIEAHRKVDFVVGNAFSMNASVQFADIILPITTQWERHSTYFFQTVKNREIQVFHSQVIEPLYEAKNDQWIGEQLLMRLGLDPKETYPITEGQNYFNAIANATVINEAGTEYELLATITEQDISEWSAKWGEVEGTPQQGKIGLMNLMEKGVYQVERHEGDNYGHIENKAFREDPETNPLRTTTSGKIEIYSQAKADLINGMSRSRVKPYSTYIQPLNGYEQSYKDWENKIKGDYPYQMTTPHYLRRAHTVFDNVPWLREAMRNPAYINTQDAVQKGIKDGDMVLVYSPYGKALRQASLTEQLMPGYIELPHGTWMDIDENTGIDRSGSDNYLSAPATSGCGVSGYNTQLVNFVKHDEEKLDPDYLRPLKSPNI